MVNTVPAPAALTALQLLGDPPATCKHAQTPTQHTPCKTRDTTYLWLHKALSFYPRFTDACAKHKPTTSHAPPARVHQTQTHSFVYPGTTRVY